MRAHRFPVAQFVLALTTTLFVVFASVARQDAPSAAPQAEAKPAAAATQSLLTLNVIDEAREPLPVAEAYLLEATYGLPLSHGWRAADASGQIQFTLSDVDPGSLEDGAGPATVIVRAPGRAWAMHKVTLPVAEPITIAVPTGHPLEIALKPTEGEVPADVTPFIFTEGNSPAAWLTVAQRMNAKEGDNAKFSVAIAERVAHGQVRIHVPDDCNTIWALVHHAGFLRGYQAGPFDRAAMDKGEIEIALPKPGSITVKIAPDTDRPHEYSACGFGVSVAPEIPDGGWSFEIAEQFADAPALETTLNDLAPGGYSIRAITGDHKSQNNRDRPDYYQMQNWAEVAARESKTVEFALQTFDEKWWREHLKGDHQLTIKITRPDGSPAAGKEYNLAFALQQFGRDLDFQHGVIPESGEITFENLPAGADGMLRMKVEDNYLGMIFIDPTEKHMQVSYGIAPAVGETAPDITLTRLDNGEKFPLSSLRGKVVLLDFWASWCGPCQEPMAHSNKLVSKRSDWHNQGTIIGASIDDKIATIQDHVNKREWHTVLQAFCGEGEPAWQSIAAKTYAVTAVPSAFLIDREGKVAWTGHPGSIDMEKEIDRLLAR